jgi:hypothetical protein
MHPSMCVCIPLTYDMDFDEIIELGPLFVDRGIGVEFRLGPVVAG